MGIREYIPRIEKAKNEKRIIWRIQSNPNGEKGEGKKRNGVVTGTVCMYVKTIRKIHI